MATSSPRDAVFVTSWWWFRSSLDPDDVSYVLFCFVCFWGLYSYDIHWYSFICFLFWLVFVYDIHWYSYLYIYIYRNAWSLPQSCSVEGSHSHSIGKINKGIRENLLPSSLRFGAKPRHLAYTYIYIHIYPIRPRLPHDYMFWCSNDTLFRQRQWVP